LFCTANSEALEDFAHFIKSRAAIGGIWGVLSKLLVNAISGKYYLMRAGASGPYLDWIENLIKHL
jgi:hypothetical protein